MIVCGRKKRDGTPCQKQPMTGQTVCRLHGGSTPAAIQKAIVRVEVSQWKAGDVHDDPVQVLLTMITQSRRRADLYSSLLEEAYRQAEMEDLTGRSLAALGSDWQLPSGVKALIGHKYALDANGNAQPVAEAIRGLVELESQERDRCVNYCAKAISAGLTERAVRVQELQAAQAHMALMAGLDAAGVTGEMRSAILEGVVNHLRLAS